MANDTSANRCGPLVIRQQVGIGRGRLPMFPVGLFEGENQIIFVFDTGFDIGSTEDVHPAFARRVKAVTAADTDGHGTHVAAIALGDFRYLQGVHALSHGVAPKAQLVSIHIDFSKEINMMTLLESAKSGGDLPAIMNHSWGFSSSEVRQSPYDSQQAGEIDAFMSKTPYCCIVLAAGNNGHKLSLRPLYTPIIDACAAAKNCITVGATFCDRPMGDSDVKIDASGNNRGFREWASFSSSGPTLEGRIAPHVLAPGAVVVSARSRAILPANLAKFVDLYGTPDIADLLLASGTSMAAPVVTGLVAVLRGMLMRGRADHTPLPSGALLKALVIHGAVDLLGTVMELPSVDGADRRTIGMTAAPNPFQGFGLVNVFNSVSPLLKLGQGTAGFIDGHLPPGEHHIQEIAIPSGATKVIVTLSYTDIPGPSMRNILQISLRYGIFVAYPLLPTDPLKRNIKWTHQNTQKIVVSLPPAVSASIFMMVQTDLQRAAFALVWEVLTE